ncbi:SusC/RagA family TonB-linked outer membrane protein [Bacteroides reticulotermitis]|uniref:TonB-dependent receptor n=2 Tax=Bacteroides reticulotermitis TaxID=1133319 RepID=W4UM48_9BACE|nr:SusC/RagA family TonB-linked outer membrane protein [Bacteroides reticulotermitis]MBB4042626.1 TonB-linked SusC/RagA family outer membrane protein [Bacteroides reticulotermitis]GAE82230.1 TonB-dependent receptor [Bacteroides reticulotermitis JCM 10512]
MNKILYTIGLIFTFSLGVMAQQKVDGVVKDSSGKPLSGVRVSKVGEFRYNSTTDDNGLFSLEVEEGDYIELNYADIILKRVKVSGNSLAFTLDSKQDAIVDLGFVKRTEETQTQSVAAIYADLLAKNATSTNRVNNAFFGLTPGLHLSQNTGWRNNASLNIRGRGGLNTGAPLVLVDGFPRGITNMTLEEIESVQVLKDGASTALWGARAADGVILINTKRGIYNSFDIDVNYRHGFNFPINKPEMADAYTYAMAQNEALHYDGLPLQYTAKQLDQFKTGMNPAYYPNVDWFKEGTRNFSQNNQANLMMRGGGKRVRYMALLDYKNEFGLLNEDYTHYSERYNSQIRNYELNLRMNLDVDITSSTKMKFGLYGIIGEDKRPNTAINTLFQNFYNVPAAAFPIKTLNNNWGSNTIFQMNPLAAIADVGYVQENRRLLNADMRITQDFSMFLKGLSADIAVAYDNSATYQDIGSKTYLYEVGYLGQNGLPVSETYGTNTTMQVTSSKLSAQFIRASVEAKVNYDRAFQNHQVGASVVYRQEMEEPLERNASYYRQNVMGIVGYNYANRYMVDVVGNYYGTSVLLKGDKFRFYPAVSAGWNLSNEAFLQNATNLDLLKLRASWGRSATDGLAYGLSNYFWVGSGNYPFGDGMTTVNGLKEQKLPMRQLELETADKFDVGVDVRLWKNLTASVDYYYDRRSNILVANNKISGMLGISSAQENIGKVESRGLELSLGWSQQHKDFSYYVNGNWAWNDSKVLENGQAYQPYSYLYTKGHKVGQLFGLEAIGYFNDEADIARSPEQTFSVVRPGDVKYKDQNNDGRIDGEDRVAIGKSTTVPEMIFGLNFGFEYKGFGVDMVFNAVTGLTKLLNVANVHQPLRHGKSNISTWYLKDKIRWTEATKDIANVPRLSTLSNDNNYQTSTQWMEDGSFLKLRNLNVHYTLPQKWSKKMKMDKLQVYAKAQNVFSIDKIKYFNCESVSMGYPDLFSLYLGVNINF